MTNWISSRRRLIAGSALASAAGLLLGGSRALAAPDVPRSKNVELILTFCKAGQDRDLEKQMSFIDEDSVYHNMPDAPIIGRAGIGALLGGYLTSSDATEIRVLAITEAKPGLVMTERVDRFRLKGGKWIDCPVMGAAEVRDGRLKQWRDYYDNEYLRKQMA
ncbi:MAG TPA: limonene-1,2-epoxide hydrolase family protein [Alphaproteobacteria bacterium]|jgi:limonene-1,2-epoxide hydrolase|nr:limonene-1,2-epoxide hydrolase family protein [Alphaproteobacteria bacterium]